MLIVDERRVAITREQAQRRGDGDVEDVARRMRTLIREVRADVEAVLERTRVEHRVPGPQDVGCEEQAADEHHPRQHQSDRAVAHAVARVLTLSVISVRSGCASTATATASRIRRPKRCAANGVASYVSPTICSSSQLTASAATSTTRSWGCGNSNARWSELARRGSANTRYGNHSRPNKLRYGANASARW